jgi:hypothetical protein
MQFHVNGLQGWEELEFNAARLTALRGGGEIFWVPFYVKDGYACHGILVEALPGGPLDVFAATQAGQEQLCLFKELIARLAPWEEANVRHIELANDLACLQGALTPTVRKPVGRLPSGRIVLGIGDAVILNDPLMGQGANNATRMAHLVARRIVDRGDGPYDPGWMQDVFDEFWEYSRFVNAISNGMCLPPEPFQMQILMTAAQNPRVAADFVHGFEDPPSLFPWFVEQAAAEAYLTCLGRPAAVVGEWPAAPRRSQPLGLRSNNPASRRGADSIISLPVDRGATLPIESSPSCGSINVVRLPSGLLQVSGYWRRFLGKGRHRTPQLGAPEREDSHA